MLQLGQLLEQAISFDLIQLIVGQQPGRRKETRKLEKSLSLPADTPSGAINRAIGRRSIKRARIIYFE